MCIASIVQIERNGTCGRSTRCKGGITRASLHAFIKTLAIPAVEKKRLLKLTPATYIGKAAELAKKISGFTRGSASFAG